MHDKFMVYGPTGFTGKLIVERAKELGLKPLLAGRSEEKLKAQAQQDGLDYVVIDLNDKAALDAGLSKVDAVLHVAGPYATTAKPMMEACVRTKTHYVDIAGELEVYQTAASLDNEARKAGVMLMPGGAFDVVLPDCLVAHLKEKLPDATELATAMVVLPFVSHGTAKSGIESMSKAIRAWRDHQLITLKEPIYKTFDFGKGPAKCISLSWGDVFTNHHTTQIPNVTSYAESSEPVEAMLNVSALKRWYLGLGFVQRKMKAMAIQMPEPSDETRKAAKMIIAGEVRNAAGKIVQARIHSPEGYTVTALTGVEIMKRILAGEAKPGFQTPSKVFGKNFAEQFEGIHIEDVAA